MSAGSPRARVSRLALFYFPVAYLGALFAVALHEVVGHGVTALLLGGEFRGFWLKWDGMGCAAAWPASQAPLSHHVTILAGGILATTVGGWLLFILAANLPARSPARIVAALLAVNCLLEGPPYLFWNAYHPEPPGDLGRIFSLLRVEGWDGAGDLRWTCLAAGGLLWALSTAAGFGLVFRTIEDALGQGRRLEGRWRAAAFLSFLGIPGAIAWYIFDWDQLAPGIGALPCHVGAASAIIASLALYPWRGGAPAPGPQVGPGGILTVWGLVGASLISMEAWLEAGLSW